MTQTLPKPFSFIIFLVFSAGILSSAERCSQSGTAVSTSTIFVITILIETGKIRPVVDKIFPFEQTNDALAYVESGRAKGKVVIKVR